MKKDFGRGSAEQFINVLENKIQQLGGTVESACNTCNIPANSGTLEDVYAADGDDTMPSDEELDIYLEQLTSKVTAEVNQLGLSIGFESDNNGNDIVCYVYESDDAENVDEYTIPMDDLTLDVDQIDTDVEYILEAIQGNTDIDNESSNSDSGFTEIASKQVADSDGFLTDYTMYRDTTTGEYVFVFGDKEMYSPNDGDFDWSCDTEEEAWEWFNDYTGISE